MRVIKPSLVATAVLSVFITPAVLGEDQIVTADPMEVIVVTGNKTEQNLSDVAGSISVITEEEISRQLVTNMGDLFRYDPSVNVTGDSGGAQNFVVRGMGGDRVLMIKDGMRMNEGYGANGNNDVVGRGFIETDTLKRVEVAKGASSALYGSDALGGIVVFTTKDPSDYLGESDTNYVNVSSGYAEVNSEYNVGTTLAHRSGNFEQMLNFIYREGEETQNYDDSRKPLDVDSTSVLYKGLYNINATDNLSMTVDFWEQNTENNIADTLAFYFRGLADFGYTITDEHAKGDKENQSVRFAYHGESKTSWYDSIDLAAYYNHSEQNDEEYVNLDINAPMFGQVGIRDMWSRYLYEQKTFGFLSNAIKQVTIDETNHTFGFGIDLETTNSKREVVEYREQNGEVILDTLTEKFPENDTLRAGIYVNDQIKFLDDKLIVTPGLRWDYYEMDPKTGTASNGDEFSAIDENQLSPNLGIVYKLTEDISGYLQYARGFKVPPYDQAYSDHDNSLFGYKILPTDSLDPETSDSYEIGFRGTASDFAFTAAYFYNKYDDFINVGLVGMEDSNGDGVSDIQLFQYENIESATIKGYEASVNYFVNPELQFYVNAAYQDGENDETGDYLSSISPLSGNLGVNYEQDNWGTDLVLRWAKSMTKVNDGETETSGFGAVDLLAHYSITKDLKINMAIHNMLDKEYIEFTSVAGAEAGEDLSNYTEAGRTFSVRASYTF